MREIITIYGIYIIEFLIAYIYYSQLFNKKKSDIKILIFGIILYLIGGTFNVFYESNIIVNTISFILINLLFSLLLYIIKFKNALFHSIILSTVVILGEYASIYLQSAIFKTNINIYKTNYTVYVIDIIFSKVIYLIICLIIIKFTQGKEEGSSKFSFSLMIYPSCVFAILILLRLQYSNIKINYSSAISIICFILLFSVLLNFIIYEKSIKKEKELLELQNEFQKKEINETYLGILEHQNKELQILAHDIKNHLTMIETISNNEKVEKYISTIYHDIIKYSIVGNTNNKILDLILNKYQTLCDMNKIDFQISIKTANLNYIDDSDLASLLNNLLDNAIEAANQSKRKFIILTIKRINEMDMLNIINSCDVKPKSDNSNLLTTKKVKSIHGFGTKSIKKITEKYGGDFEWNFDSIDNTFHSTIIFGNR